MEKLDGAKRVGLRDKEAHKLIAVYPHVVEGGSTEIDEKVKFWYYQKDCGAEENLRNYYVDRVTDEEIKALQ